MELWKCFLCGKILWFWQNYDQHYDAKLMRMFWAHEKCVKFRGVKFTQ